jgi:Major Facilitator Superfamily
VNIPITAVAIVLIVIGLKEETGERRAPKLDLSGAATLLVALLILFYALAKSSHSIQPLNTATLGMIGIALAILTLFFFIERRAEEPIIPLDLFHLSLFRTSAAVTTLASMGVFGAITYIPLYLQGVLGLTASGAGMALLLLSMGWTAGSLLAGRLINRSGYRFVGAAGMILLAFGFGLFLISSDVGVVTVLISGTAIGTGMGLANLTTLVAIQSAVWPQRMGVATSTIMLFRTFGGAFAVSLMGTVLLKQMQRGLARLGGSGAGDLAAELREKLAHPQNLLDPATRGLIPPDLLPKLVELLADSVWYAFLTAFALMLLGVAVSSYLGSYTPATTPRPSTPPNR